jgi:plastocyanin
MTLSRPNHPVLKGTASSRPIVMLFILTVAVVAAVYAKPALTPSQENAAKYVVTIDNFSFSPMTLTVPAGTQVTWINHDDVPHTVVSTDNKFKSHALDTNEKFSYTFADAGTYEYYCSVHPKMTGKVIVESK